MGELEFRVALQRVDPMRDRRAVGRDELGRRGGSRRPHVGDEIGECGVCLVANR